MIESGFVENREELSRGAECRWLALLALAALALFSVGLGRTGFQGTDENRYSEVAKEIGGPNSPFVMHLYGVLYPDKPPIFFWMIKASYELLGEVSPLSARLPLLLSTLAALLFAYLAMRQFYGPRTALWGLALLMLSFRFVWAGRWLRLDMPLMMFVCGSFWATARILFPKNSQRPAGVGWAILAWSMMTLATLTKGTGLPVWLGSLVAYSIWQRSWQPLKAHRPLIGIAAMLAIVAAWALPAWKFGGHEYLGAMIGTHVIERYVGEVRHNAWIGYYFINIIPDGLPTTILLIPALAWAWRQRRDEEEGSRLRFLLAWFGFTFLFFSLCHGKRPQYLLPLYPALTLLVARMMEEAELGRISPKWARRCLWAVAGVMVLGGAVALPLRKHFPGDFLMDPSPGLLVGAVAAIAGAGLAAGWLLKRDRLQKALAACLMGFFLTHLMIFGLYFPQQYDNRVAREVAAQVGHAGQPSALVGLYGYKDSFLLFGDIQPRPFKSRNDLREFAGEQHGRWVVSKTRSLDKVMEVLEPSAWQAMGEWHDIGDPEPFTLLHRTDWSGKGIRDKPPAGADAGE